MTTRSSSGSWRAGEPLGPALHDCYDTLNQLDPGTRRVDALPDDVPNPAPRQRYDLRLYTTWMAALPDRRPTTRQPRQPDPQCLPQIAGDGASTDSTDELVGGSHQLPTRRRRVAGSRPASAR